MIKLNLIYPKQYFFKKQKFEKFVFCNYVTNVSDNITVPFAAKYIPKVVEKDKYKKWESLGYFQPKHEASKGNNFETFSMILPPPNITGTLHLGHVLTITIQDILCRWNRMRGYSVLWIPGIDHAGIATHVMVEKNLQKKTGLKRQDIGREKFVQLILEWKASKANKIVNQLKQLGTSVDWSKFTYTLDSKQSTAVTNALIKLFEDDMLYQENMLVNWSSHLRSTISDIEIDYCLVEKPTLFSIPGHHKPIEFGLIYDIALKVLNSDKEIVLSTTRPETLFGDTAIAVHPEDTRYNHLQGALLYHPLRRQPIPLIFDKSVIKDFGTGAVKITPGHNKTDFEVAKRHNLPVITIFSDDGRMNDACEDYVGEPRYSVREKIIARLSDMNLLREVKPHVVQIPICSRSNDIVEQMLKPQWFVKCHKLAQKSIEAVESGNLIIEPERHVQNYCEWLKNIKDWCISRQLWWGHRLPLYKTEFGWVAAQSVDEARQKAKNKFNVDCFVLEQDEDVLDTWFSSALLPFSAFNWPETDIMYEKYYPLSLMETGFDILNLWVSRMIMLGLYFTDKLPFKKVFLHGMICDSINRKMSKSLGNIIEPDNIVNGITLKNLNRTVEMNYEAGLISEEELQKAFIYQEKIFPQGIPACGTDALRFTMASYSLTDQTLRFNSQECYNNMLFCTKMWEASKFTIGWALKFDITPTSDVKPIFPWHFWLLHQLSCTVSTVNKNLEDMQFHNVTKSLKQFFHNDFCDVFLEISKPVLKLGSEDEARATCSVMLHCLEVYLRLVSPVMPFIADELYSYLPKCSEKLVANMVFPRAEEYVCWKNETVYNEMILIKDMTRCIRSLITTLRCKKPETDVLVTTDRIGVISRYIGVIQSLVRCRSVTVKDNSSEIIAPANPVNRDAIVYVLFENITQTQVRNNFDLLDSQVFRLCRDFENIINHPECSENNDNILLELLDEWKRVKYKVDIWYENRNVDNVIIDDIITMTGYIQKLHILHETLQDVLNSLEIGILKSETVN
ncbi:hypothetical protein PGB90_008988 [Kerria lacca]